MSFTVARWLPVAGFILATGVILADAGRPAQAGSGYYPPQWCVRAYDGATDCSYFTLEQCREAVWGTGGDCAINPRFAGYPDRPYRKQRRYYR